MIPTAKIQLSNWRLFKNEMFCLPFEPCVIVDSNGSGKTSFLSALYSLMTGLPWINLKFQDMLSIGESYFGVQSEDADWFISGKLSSSGKLITKYSSPQSYPLPRIISYIPNDNNWLYLERTEKLNILDKYATNIYGDEFSEAQKKIQYFVKQKSKVLQHFLETGFEDILLSHSYTKEINNASGVVRSKRKLILDTFIQSSDLFLSWLEKPLDIDISYYEPNHKGVRVESRILPETFVDIQQLWETEKKAGKVLFGSHRDDFVFTVQNRALETLLSRGEMRLFVLFCKHIASQSIQKNNSEMIWLLDDVFNEFDSKRERSLFEHVLNKSGGFVATSTHSTSLQVRHDSLSKFLDTKYRP